MPAYMSHAVMMENLYEENKHEEKIFKIHLDLDELKTYSLGVDLASLSKNIVNNPHTSDTRSFFLNMIDYIKKRNLIENKHDIACLYGHVAHYFMDVCMHPFIYSIENSCKKVSSIPNHHLIEGYISTYLVKKILEKDIMEVNEEYFNQADLNIISVRDMLDTVYGEIYGDGNITKTYKATLQLFSNIERIAKSGLFSKENLIHFSKFDEFLRINHLSYSDLNNDYRNYYINPSNGEMKNFNVLEMYYLSIYMTIDAICDINNVLYNDKALSKLENVFTNLSYNTGLPCEQGEQMYYIKKR